ncbi:MAG: type pilus assembly protein PilO [Phycisphaerales bacterium]|jgi:Tfp pilus assembly protein PilO|nr:type pilus assembly protein PilO [Phycisphaerales bacterium]MEA2736643.1 type pilus assembly protein PilO [Humisphaera sp.]
MRTLQTQAEWCARAQWVLGVTLIVMIIGFYAIAYRPNKEKLDGLETQIAAKRRDLTSNRTRVQILPDVLLAVNEMRNRLERFDKKLPKAPELHAFINSITEVSSQAGLRNKWTVEPGVPVRSDLYAEWPISLKFEGDFNSVFNFLRRAEEMQRLTRVKGLKIRGLEAAGKPGQVQVELSMNIYFAEG